MPVMLASMGLHAVPSNELPPVVTAPGVVCAPRRVGIECRMNSDVLVQSVKTAIHSLLVVKARLPLLAEIDAAFVRQAPKAGSIVRNDVIFQLIRDSFDMLVIDLASMREGLVGPYGVFKLLRASRACFTAFSIDNVQVAPTIWLDGAPSPAGQAASHRQDRQKAAARLNERVDHLFGCPPPVTDAHVTELVDRFRQETQPIMDDRNRVRAHRYEGVSNGHGFRMTVDAVPSQIAVFER